MSRQRWELEFWPVSSLTCTQSMVGLSFVGKIWNKSDSKHSMSLQDARVFEPDTDDCNGALPRSACIGHVVEDQVWPAPPPPACPARRSWSWWWWSRSPKALKWSEHYCCLFTIRIIVMSNDHFTRSIIRDSQVFVRVLHQKIYLAWWNYLDRPDLNWNRIKFSRPLVSQVFVMHTCGCPGTLPRSMSWLETMQKDQTVGISIC